MSAFIGWCGLATVWICTAQLLARVGRTWPRLVGLVCGALVASFIGWFGAVVAVGVFTSVVVWPALSSPTTSARLGGSVPHAWARQLRRHWATIAHGCGLAVPRTGLLPELGARPRVQGGDVVTARVRLALGQTVGDVQGVAPRLAAALNARDCEVVAAGSAHCELRWHWSDPLVSEVAYPVADGNFESIPLGRNGSGDVVSTPILYSNTLIAGLPGQGKSTSLNCLMVGLSVLPMTIVGIDLKGGMELRPWAPRLARLATDADAALELLREVVDAVSFHAEVLADRRLKKVSVDAPEITPIALVIDELAELISTGDRKRDQEAVLYLRRVLQLGRAVGVTVIACTQRPSADVVPTAIRDLIGVRVGHFLPDRASAELVMGVWSTEAPLHTLDLPGQCYVTVNGSEPERIRAARVDDQFIQTIATESAFLADLQPWPLVPSPSNSASTKESVK